MKMKRTENQEPELCTERVIDESTQEQSVSESKVDVPDGGWGWLTCGGTFAVNFIVFGIHNSFGVIYANLLDELQMGKAETAWIGALAMGLNFFCGPLTSWLCDRYGCRAVAFVGGFFSVLGLLLTSFVKEPPTMYVTYGLLFGVGSSLSFVSSIVALGDYFRRRLALANGIATSGSGVGSLVAGPVINHLLGTTGWQNCMRILSGFAVLLWIAALLYRPNTNIDRSERARARLFDPKIWRNKAYVLWVFTVALFQFGYLIPFVHLVKYAEDLGVSKSKGAWLIGFLSIMSTLGRVLFGKICEIKKVNRMYVYQFSIFVIGMSTLLCPLASSYGGLIGYSLTFGFFDGCFVGQVTVITADIVGHENLSQGIGNLFGCLAVPMSFGPPVAGWLYEGSGSYNTAFFVSGSVAILSTILVFFVSILKRKTDSLEVFNSPEINTSHSDNVASTEKCKGNLDSSSYSFHSQSDNGQLLVSDNDGSLFYYKGEKMREIFRDLERETVI